MILSFFKLYQRPNHNSVTRVEPTGYISSVANHTYIYKPGYTREMVYKISCCLQVRKKLSKYIFDNINIYFLLNGISNGCKSNLTLFSFEPKSPDKYWPYHWFRPTRGLYPADVSSLLWSWSTYCVVLIAKCQPHDGWYIITLWLSQP